MFKPTEGAQSLALHGHAQPMPPSMQGAQICCLQGEARAPVHGKGRRGPQFLVCRAAGAWAGGRAAPERAHEEGGAASCQWEELLPGFQGEGGGAEDPVFPPPRLCMEMRRRKDAAAFSGKGCSFLAAAEAAAAGAHAAGSHLI